MVTWRYRAQINSQVVGSVGGKFNGIGLTEDSSQVCSGDAFQVEIRGLGLSRSQPSHRDEAPYRWGPTEAPLLGPGDEGIMTEKPGVS